MLLPLRSPSVAYHRLLRPASRRTILRSAAPHTSSHARFLLTRGLFHSLFLPVFTRGRHLTEKELERSLAMGIMRKEVQQLRGLVGSLGKVNCGLTGCKNDPHRR